MASFLTSLTETAVISARSRHGGRLERVGEEAVKRRDGQNLGLPRRSDDGVGVVVGFERVLDGQANLIGRQARVLQLKFERLITLRRDLKRDRIDQRSFVSGLIDRVAINLRFGRDLFGAKVMDSAEKLVDLGLILVPAGLEREDRHVVARVA